MGADHQGLSGFEDLPPDQDTLSIGRSAQVPESRQCSTGEQRELISGTKSSEQTSETL